MFLNLPYASPGPFFKVRVVPRKHIIWLKQIIRQTQRIIKASEPSEPREGGGGKKRKTAWILPWIVVAAGAENGENWAGGWWTDLSLLLAPASSHWQHHSGKEKGTFRDSGFPALCIRTVHIMTLLQLSSFWCGPFHTSCSWICLKCCSQNGVLTFSLQTLP